MKKKEIISVVVIAVIAVAMILGYRFYNSQKYGTNNSTPTPTSSTVQTTPDTTPSASTDPNEVVVQIVHGNEVIYTFSPDEDQEYWFEGSYGKMMLEVKDGQWRVTNEDCPNHTCSSIGFVSVDNYFPIICIPNEVYIVIGE